MSKFDIFDKSTWQVDPIDIAEQINNKCIRAVSNWIGPLKCLKNDLETKYFNQGPEFKTANWLREHNPEAYSLMEIHVGIGNDRISELLHDVNYVLDQWASNASAEARCDVWRSLIPRLEKFKELYSDINSHHEFLEKLKIEVATKVTGNAAWKIYMQLAKERDDLRIQLQEESGEESPDSSD